MAQLQIQINDELLDEARTILDSMGLDEEGAVAMFFEELIHDHRSTCLMAEESEIESTHSEHKEHME